VEQLLHAGSVASLQVLYERRRVRYQTYIDHCKTASPEEAAQSWWESMTAPAGDQSPTTDEPAPDDPITQGPAADDAARNERQDQDPGKVNGRLKAKEWGSDNSTGNQ